jgi:Flp pilus assembly protein TadG
METRGNNLARVREPTKNLRREDGQALVELALVVPLLLFIIFAIIDFGLAINQYNNTTNLANLGARATSVLSTNSTLPSCTYRPSGGSATTYQTLVGYLDCEGASEGSLSQVGATVCDSSATTGTPTVFNTGDTLSIKVSDNFNWLGILVGGVGRIGGVTGNNSSIAIASTATMRMEGTITSPASSTWLSASSQDAPGSSTTVGTPTVTNSGC